MSMLGWMLLLSLSRKQVGLQDHGYIGVDRSGFARQTWHEVNWKARFLQKLLRCGFEVGECAAGAVV